MPKFISNIVKPIIFSLAAFSASIASADCLNLDLFITNGYREDRISTKVKTKDLLNGKYASKHIKVSPQKMYQLGGIGYYEVCGWKFRADGNFAWSKKESGHYSELNESHSSEFNYAGKIRNSKITDFTFGGGYSLCPIPCISIIPMAGVSYRSMKIHSKHPLIDGFSNSILANLEYNNRIKGPWVGYDVILQISSLVLRSGYEHHFANWHGNRELRETKPSYSSSSSFCSSSSSSSSNSDKDRDFFYSRRSKGARGDVVYVDAHWNFCNGLSVGFGAKFQQWKLTRGPLSSLKKLDPFQRRNPRKENSLKWETIAVTFDVGGHF